MLISDTFVRVASEQFMRVISRSSNFSKIGAKRAMTLSEKELTCLVFSLNKSPFTKYPAMISQASLCLCQLVKIVFQLRDLLCIPVDR